MASTLEYMQFATGVYAATDANTLDPTTATGWSRIGWQSDTELGFSVGIYMNDANQEMVISYTGTNELAVDPLAGWSAGFGLPAPQIFAAVDFYFTYRDAYPDSLVSG